MSDPGAFLSRWSRRKLATRSSPAPEVESLPDEPAAVAPAADAETAPALDALPSIEDIVADTDISAFLQPGVPLDVARSALRRAWSTDTAIRDFIGPADYAWDFNAPNAMAGFGLLGLTDALRDEMLQALVGAPEKPQAKPVEAEREPEAFPEASCPQIPLPRSAAATPETPDVLDRDTAPRLRQSIRRHGRALPQ